MILFLIPSIANFILEIRKFRRLRKNDPPHNVMIMSGDHIYLATPKFFKEKGYGTLADFRPKTGNEAKINDEVEDSWVWRQLMCLPWQAEEQRKKRKRESGSDRLSNSTI